MNRKEVKSFLPILQAFADGKEIECHEEDKWYKVLEICNEMNPQDYRIKPEHKYRPFKDAEECWQEIRKHEPFIKYKVIERSKDVYLIIQRIKTDGIETDVERLDFETAFEWFTFSDGTPFGILEEE